MTTITARKVSASAVVLTPFTPQITARKVGASAVVLTFPDFGITARKVSATATVLGDGTGDARQTASGNRPAYRAGPDPYVEFGPGETLSVNLLFPGKYTLIRYKADDTFEITTMTLTPGPFVLDNDFNQAALVLNASTIAIASIKHTMRVRAGNA